MKKAVICRDNRAVHLELNHRLRLADGFNLSGKIGAARLLLGNVGRIFDNLDRRTVEIENRVVGGLKPDCLSTFAQPLELAGFVLTTLQSFPERLVFRTLLGGVIDEQTVMLAHDLVQTVTHRVEKSVIRRNNRAVHLEFDHRLRLADGFHLSGKVGELLGEPHLFGDVVPGDEVTGAMAVGTANTVECRPQCDLIQLEFRFIRQCRRTLQASQQSLGF